MKDQRIIDVIPELYKKFLPSFFKTRIPMETAATCDDCAMWMGPEDGDSSDLFFSRNTKCCTYYPNLPNYHVGALLSTSSPVLLEGQNRVRKVIRSRVGVTPYGLQRPRKYALLNKNALHAFGRSKSLLCPFYEQNYGKCTVWHHRYSRCSTWFCKYSAGEDGKAFWTVFFKYLVYIEDVLVQYTLYKMGWEPGNIISPHSLEGSLTSQEIEGKPLVRKEYQKLWKDWKEREEDFYVETYRLVSEISPNIFEKISGITQKILLVELQSKCQSILNPQLPSSLKRNPKLIVNKTNRGTYFLIGYSGSDPVEVSKRIYDILDFFDGWRSNKEAIRLIRQQMHTEPSQSLLIQLYRFRILVEP